MAFSTWTKSQTAFFLSQLLLESSLHHHMLGLMVSHQRLQFSKQQVSHSIHNGSVYCSGIVSHPCCIVTAIPPTGLSLQGMSAGALASLGIPGAAAAGRLSFSGFNAGGNSVMLVSNLNPEVSHFF